MQENNFPIKSETSFDVIGKYFHDLKTVLFEPSKFFRNLPLNGGLSGPLCFALITHWLGAFCNYLWGIANIGFTQQMFHRFVHFSSRFSDNGGAIDSPGKAASQNWFQNLGGHENFFNWLWGAGGVLLDPFYTVVILLITAVLVHAGAKLLIPQKVDANQNLIGRPVQFESALRVVAFGMSPAIFAAIPYAGSLITSIYVAFVTVIGAREVYRISTGRAFFVGLFPKVLFLGIIGLGMLVAAMFFLKFIVSMFL